MVTVGLRVPTTKIRDSSAFDVKTYVALYNRPIKNEHQVHMYIANV
jgi:hypothetical protein